MANTLGRNRNLGSPFGGGAGPDPDGIAARRRARARPEIPSVGDAAAPPPSAPGRRLSPEERLALQERHRARTTPTPPAGPAGSPSPAAEQATSTGVVTRSASRLAGSTPIVAPPSAGTSTRRPAPRMPRAQERPTPMPRGLVAIGAVLIAGLAVVAFAGGRIFGSAGDEPPTSQGRSLAAGAGAVVGSPTAATPAPLPRLTLAPPADATPAAAAFTGPRAPVVCLDPGHGGSDAGFQRILTDAAPAMDESILVLQHAWDLEARLKLQGFEVVMTRRDDVDVNAARRDVNGDGKTARDDRPDPDGGPGSNTYRTLDELQARINVCNDADADLLVSMHVNGHNTPEPQGFEAIFTEERPFGDRNELFARLAYTNLKRQLGAIGYVSDLPERGYFPDTALEVDTKKSVLDNIVMTGPDVPKLKIRASKMPGATVEALFVSNDYDAAILDSPAGREAIVSGYETAILAYFDEHPPEQR